MKKISGQRVVRSKTSKHFEPSVDLTGMRFGEWSVLKYAGKELRFSAGQRNIRYMWYCRCNCGVERKVDHYNLVKGLSTKCRTRHATGTNKLHVAWQRIRKSGQLPEEWRDFSSFRRAVGDPPNSKAFLIRCDLTQPHSAKNTMWVSPARLRQVRKKAREERILQDAMLRSIRTAQTKRQRIGCLLEARKAGYNCQVLASAAGMTHQAVYGLIRRHMSRQTQ